MTHNQRHLRALGALLAPLLTLAAAVPAHTAPGDTPNSGKPQESYSDATYVVKLSAEPVATYEGGLPRLARTAPNPGQRLDADSGAVRKYLRHLDARREKVLDAVPRVKKLYDYDYATYGFAAELTGSQAQKLAATPGVVSVTRNKVYRLAPPAGRSAPQDVAPETTKSTAMTKAAAPEAGTTTQATAAEGTAPAPLPDIPAFLGLSGNKGLWSKSGGPEHAGEGMIIGVVDTGFDPENPMLAPLPEPRPDADAIARKWHGSCEKGGEPDPADNVTCNNKVIGADWFGAGIPEVSDTEVDSPLDAGSHGTHTATTAAGDYATPVSVPGADMSGKLSGVAPAARLAVYKACWDDQCATVDTTAAIDKAVADGVDVINYSIGGELTDLTSMDAMFNAARAGVFVSAVAGNSGPDTVMNTAPWITTAAAGTYDTEYRNSLVLGDGSRFTNLGVGTKVPSAPLVNAVDARKESADVTEAAMCYPNTLDPAKVKGKIVACDRGVIAISAKAAEVRRGGGVAVVVSNTPSTGQNLIQGPFAFPTFPLGHEDGAKVRAYAATDGATAELTPSESSRVQAPAVTGFSSGGPDPFSTGDLFKPDITAPGKDIVAGTVPGTSYGYQGQFGFLSGTSMAAPHISGLSALLKSLHPDWSPMEVKSALMTTATTTDNAGEPIGRQGYDSATPLDYGAGQVRPLSAADPGLVYDSTSADWTSYLCAVGAKPTTPDGADACATAKRIDPSDLNYASMAVGDLTGQQTLTRTVTNVATQTATYRAVLQTPPGFKAEVTPKRLTLKPGESAAYQVKLTRTAAPYGEWSFGSLTWSDAHSRHRVTSPIALRAVLLAAPAEVAAAGGQNSITLTPQVGWSGELTATTRGLSVGKKTTGTLTGTDTNADSSGAPDPSDAIAKVSVHVPDDALLTRVAITSADHLAGSDLDLYAFDKDGRSVGRTPQGDSDEWIDLPPGDYDVYVVQYELPPGVTSQQFTLWTWQIGQGEPDVKATVSPAARQVRPGDRVDVTMTWPGAEQDKRYLGAVEFGDGSASVGHTVVTVIP